MPSPPVRAMAVLSAVGVLAVLLAAALDDRRLAFTLGVSARIPAATLEHGEEVCQRPIFVPERFGRVRLVVATFDRPGSPLAVTVNNISGDRVLARGSLPAGYEDNSSPVVDLDRDVRSGRVVSVCIRDMGSGPVLLRGNQDLAVRGSTLVTSHGAVPRDLALVFLRREPESALSMLPDIVRRAAMWRPGWVGPWTIWLLLGAVALIVPSLLVLSVAQARREDEAGS